MYDFEVILGKCERGAGAIDGCVDADARDAYFGEVLDDRAEVCRRVQEARPQSTVALCRAIWAI